MSLFRRRAIADANSNGDAPLMGRTIRRTPDVVSTTHDGMTVVLNAARGQYHTLNSVGTRVWELLAHGATPEHIVDTLCAEYDMAAGVGIDAVQRDVRVLLSQLANAGLVTVGADL